MSKIKFNDLFDVETLEFLLENLSTERIESRTNNGIYSLISKEDVASTYEDEEERDENYLIRELYIAMEEAKNAFNAVEKIIYIKNALNIGKYIDPDSLTSVAVDNTGTISIGTSI